MSDDSAPAPYARAYWAPGRPPVAGPHLSASAPPAKSFNAQTHCALCGVEVSWERGYVSETRGTGETAVFCVPCHDAVGLKMVDDNEEAEPWR